MPESRVITRLFAFQVAIAVLDPHSHAQATIAYADVDSIVASLFTLHCSDRKLGNLANSGECLPKREHAKTARGILATRADPCTF